MGKEVKLLLAARAGDTLAFEQIVKKYQSLVCAITFSGTGRKETSEELAQETFLSAWKNLDQLTDPKGFRAWLCAIARNMVFRNYRKKRPEQLDSSAIENISDNSPNPSDNMIIQEEQAMLEDSLMRIPAEYREPLVMYYRGGKSTRQVAEVLGLNESTVRTRLHRARGMLREELAAKIERTLEKTGPDKRFTKCVMGAIGAAGLASAAASAGTAVNGAATSAPAGIAGVMSTVTAKAVTAVVVAAVTLGAVFVYNHLKDTEPTFEKPLVTATDKHQEIAVTPKMTGNTVKANPAAANLTNTIEAQPVSQIISDLPTASETIECVHACLKEKDAESEIWVKGDKMWRVNFGDIEKICDGKRVLVLDHRNKEASISSDGLKQPQEILGPLMTVEFVSKNFDPAKKEITVNQAGVSCTVRQNPDRESQQGKVVFDVFESNSNELLGIVWIDGQTGKLNRIEDHETQGGLIGEWHYDYESIDDSMFLTKVPKGYVLDEGRYINGTVVDANFNPVTDANIYVTGLFVGQAKEIVTQTNKDGFFEYELKFQRDDWGIRFPVVIRAESPSYPDMAAWTCILDPETEIEQWPEWMPPIDPEVVVTRLEPRKGKATCKSIQALWLQFEPAGAISGFVTNKQGVPIKDAAVDAFLSLDLKVNKKRDGYLRPSLGISTKTDENGYYKITGIPTLQGYASPKRNESKRCYVGAVANGYFRNSQNVQNAVGSGNSDITFLEEKRCDFILSKNDLTIKGRVIDNYGNPLAHYEGVSYKEKGSNSMHHSGRLDSQGQFTIYNAPRANTIIIEKDTVNDSYDWLDDKETKHLEFVLYLEKEFEFKVPADVNVFDVGDLILDYPDITAEIYIVDYQGNPVGFVECSFVGLGSKELLKDRYWKVTDEKEGKCIIENLPRAESGGKSRSFRPISLRPYEKAPKKYRKMLEQFPNLTYYHLKYPGDYKHYIFELVLPRKNHRKDYRMRIYSPEGELLLEED